MTKWIYIVALILFAAILVYYIFDPAAPRAEEPMTKTGVCTVSKSMGSPQYKCLEELNG
jgi:hypothetical protein